MTARQCNKCGTEFDTGSNGINCPNCPIKK